MKKCVFKIAFIVFCVVIMYCHVSFADWIFDAEEGWRFVTENGSFAKNSIVRKDGLKFYLDDTGHVYKEGMVTFENNVTYYFNYFGAMATDCWVKVDPYTIEDRTEPIPEYYYYYFGSDGKAIKGTTGKPRFYYLDGKTYLFNEYGQLLVGWINEDGTVVDSEENEHPYEEALYYSNKDGELVSGWLRAENSYKDEEYVKDQKYLWFYFQPRTFKKRGYRKFEEKDIGNGHYYFSDKGYLYTDFSAYNLDNERREEFYGEDKGGKKYKAQWAWTIPPDDDTYSNEEKSEKHWMYLEKSGKPVKNEIRKINKKYYSFSENGIMQSGVVAYLNGTILFTPSMEETSAEDIVKKGKYTYYKDGKKYYFYDTVGYQNVPHSAPEPYYIGGQDYIDDEYDVRMISFGTMDKEINTLRHFSHTGRFAELDVHDDQTCPYNPNLLFFYFTDDGTMVNGRKKVHFLDGEYYYGGNRNGHFKDMRNNRYYYDGIELAADKEIGYGLYTVERSLSQTTHENLYRWVFAPLSYNDNGTSELPAMFQHYYEKTIDNESLYKVLNANGKIVKGKKKAYKDKQGRYWYIEPNGDWFYGIFNTEVKKDNSKWIKLRTKINKNTCPEVLKTGSLQEKINFLKGYDFATGKYEISKIFNEDFKDDYTFFKAGSIIDMKAEIVKDNPEELSFSIMYNGMLYKSMYDDKVVHIPFGMSDINGDTATFFHETNDFEILPDDNDFFVNCCWDDYDAIDFMCRFDSDGVRNIDFWSW